MHIWYAHLQSQVTKHYKAHVAKFYGQFRLIRSVWEHQNFLCSKLIEIVILWVYYTIPFGFSLFRYFWDIVFPLLNYFVWQRITGEGSLPEMRIWSILWIKSVLKWCMHLSRSLFFIFQLLGECHCWWTKESPRAHVAKFYGRFRLMRSVWEHQNFPCSKLIEIVIWWVYYTIPFGFSLFRYFWDIVFPLLNYFVWQRITDEGSVPEMRIWSILWIKSVLKWCMHLSRSLFFIFQLLGECHCWWTKESPRAHVAKFYGRFRLIRSVWEHQNYPCSKLIEIVILWVYYTIPFGFSLFRYFWDIVFPLLNYFVWQRITDEGSVPEMRIWSILWIKSVLKWCMHLSRSLFLYSLISVHIDYWTFYLAKLLGRGARAPCAPPPGSHAHVTGCKTRKSA